MVDLALSCTASTEEGVFSVDKVRQSWPNAQGYRIAKPLFITEVGC